MRLPHHTQLNLNSTDLEGPVLLSLFRSPVFINVLLSKATSQLGDI